MGAHCSIVHRGNVAAPHRWNGRVLARAGRSGYHAPTLHASQSSAQFTSHLSGVLTRAQSELCCAVTLSGGIRRRIVGALLLSLLATIRPTAAAPADVGFMDHSYAASSVSDPTKDKPQSKVWFADGSWWGGLFVTGSNDYRIHKYNATSHTWAATSTVVDERNGSQGDYLWDGIGALRCVGEHR